MEKAYQLAASGRFISVSDIRNHLHRDGFTHFELTALNGKAMRKQLRKLIEEANGAAAREAESDASVGVPLTGKIAPLTGKI